MQIKQDYSSSSKSTYDQKIIFTGPDFGGGFLFPWSNHRLYYVDNSADTDKWTVAGITSSGTALSMFGENAKVTVTAQYNSGGAFAIGGPARPGMPDYLKMP